MLKIKGSILLLAWCIRLKEQLDIQDRNKDQKIQDEMEGYPNEEKKLAIQWRKDI